MYWSMIEKIWICYEFLDAQRISGFSIDFWVHDRLMDSRWMSGCTVSFGFMLGFWIHNLEIRRVSLKGVADLKSKTLLHGSGKLVKGPLRTGKGRVGTWKFRNLGILRSGDLDIQKSGFNKIPNIQIIIIQIHSAQNVGKVWISRKQILLVRFWCHFRHFFHWPEKYKPCVNFVDFPWWANGLYSPGLGSCAGVIFGYCSIVCKHSLG